MLTHGFLLDEQGRKMSKSIGNVMDPLAIVNKHGADVLRLWVSSSDFSNDVTIGPNIIGNYIHVTILLTLLQMYKSMC